MALAGFRRGNDKYPEWKVAPPTAPRGGEVLSRKSRTNTKQQKLKDSAQSRIALYHVLLEQGTLVAPRLWVEESVGRANLNEHENPIILCLR